MPPSRKLRSRSGAVPTHRARPRHAAAGDALLGRARIGIGFLCRVATVGDGRFGGGDEALVTGGHGCVPGARQGSDRGREDALPLPPVSDWHPGTPGPPLQGEPPPAGVPNGAGAVWLDYNGSAFSGATRPPRLSLEMRQHRADMLASSWVNVRFRTHCTSRQWRTADAQWIRSGWRLVSHRSSGCRE